MKKFLMAVPFSIIVVCLGCFSFGSLLSLYSSVLMYAFGGVGLVFLTIFILRIIFLREEVLEDIKNPINSSVAATFPMSLMILCTFIIDEFSYFAMVLWFMGIIIQIAIITLFSYFLVIKKFDFNNVMPSWFVTYVGIGIVSVTSLKMNHLLMGKLVIGFSFLMFLILFPIMIYRVFHYEKLGDNLIPSLCIFVAPSSLILTGFLNSFTTYSYFLIIFLFTVSTIVFSIILLYVPKIIKNKFYPSFGALTFPFSITATATTTLYQKVFSYNIIKYLAYFETLVTFFLIIYVIISFLKYIIGRYYEISKLTLDEK